MMLRDTARYSLRARSQTERDARQGTSSREDAAVEQLILLADAERVLIFYEF